MYIPIIKTTSAEIRGFRELSDDIKKDVLPLFELTKGRKHKKLYPEGRLEEALEKALSAQPEEKLILDLTSHDDLINSQIEELFDSSNGYDKWCTFIENTKGIDRIIPTVQIEIDDALESARSDIEKQVKRLEELCGRVVLRSDLEIEKEELSKIVKWVIESLSTPDNLIIIIDCGYIKPHTSRLYAQEVIDRVKNILNFITDVKLKIAVSSSSFPKIVTAPNYGQDHFGHFNLEEVSLHRELIATNLNVEWIYSDYALIHPIRYITRGGSWIPRIDAPLENEIFYFRYRRDEGGYVSAARRVVGYSRYSEVKDCWGKEQIELAAKGTPAGRGPAFWISVRSNIHITTQSVRTSTARR